MLKLLPPKLNLVALVSVEVLRSALHLFMMQQQSYQDETSVIFL